MPRHLLTSWRWEDLPESRRLTDGTTSYAASNQFKKMRVRPGDTLWLVNVEKNGTHSTGQLYLLGRLVVGQVLTLPEAIAERGISRVRRDRQHHVTAQPGTERPYQRIHLNQIADSLRFESNVADRLTIQSNGLIDGRQLQSIRPLTPASVAILRRRMDENEAD